MIGGWNPRDRLRPTRIERGFVETPTSWPSACLNQPALPLPLAEVGDVWAHGSNPPPTRTPTRSPLPVVPKRRIQGAQFDQSATADDPPITGEVVLPERLFPRTERDHDPWRDGHRWAVAGGRERADSRRHPDRLRVVDRVTDPAHQPCPRSGRMEGVSSIGQDLLEERRRRHSAGDPRITPEGREILLRLTTGDRIDEFQAALDSDLREYAGREGYRSEDA